MTTRLPAHLKGFEIIVPEAPCQVLLLFDSGVSALVGSPEFSFHRCWNIFLSYDLFPLASKSGLGNCYIFPQSQSKRKQRNTLAQIFALLKLKNNSVELERGANS